MTPRAEIFEAPRSADLECGKRNLKRSQEVPFKATGRETVAEDVPEKEKVIQSISVLNPISPGVLGPGNTPGGAQSAHTQFKGSKLLFDLETWCVLSEICIDFTRKEKNWSKAQKVSDILRFEIFLDLRFCHDLTHENGRNSLNF